MERVHGHILIVDDDAEIRETMTVALGHDGFSVAVAADGQEALEQLETACFDVVVCEIQIPKVSGLDVLREVITLSTDTEIVMMAAHGSRGSVTMALHLGAFDFVRKPFHLDDLSLTVACAVERRRLRSLSYRMASLGGLAARITSPLSYVLANHELAKRRP